MPNRTDRAAFEARLAPASLLLALVVAGCSSSSDAGGATADASSDTGHSTPGDDATTDDGASPDACPWPSCAATDAGPSAPADAGPADSGGTTDAASSDAGNPSDGGAECTVASDCRLYSNECGGCACDALPHGAPAPTCPGNPVACLRDPCSGESAVCDLGRCVTSP